MDIDFAREYAAYSNAELLRITLLPHQYQPAAVAAAQALLAERNVTEEEELQAQEGILPKPRHQPASIPWQTGDDLFQDATLPDFATIQRRWWIIAGTIGLSIIFYVQLHLKILMRGPSSPGFNTIDQLTGIVIMVLQVSSFWLYWQKRKWGWMLTVAWAVNVGITNLFSLIALIYYQYNYQPVFLKDILEVIFNMLLLAVSVTLLCTPALKSFYGIDQKTGKRTLTISFGLTLLYCTILLGGMYLLRRE